MTQEVLTERKGAILKQSYAFAVRIVNLYKYLKEEKREYVMSKQLLRSGTSVGAMVRESQNAESTPDFIHKLAIAQKECDESMYWLELLKDTSFLNQNEFEDLSKDAGSLLRMIKSAIISSKTRGKK